MNRWMVTGVLTALVGFGCGDDDGGTPDMTPGMDMGPGLDMGPGVDMNPGDMPVGDPADGYDRVQDAYDALTEATCNCDLGGFEDVASCVGVQQVGDEVRDCEDAAYRSMVSAAYPAYACEALIIEAYAECVADSDCSEAAQGACLTTAQGAFGDCPEPVDLGTTVDECIATNATGAASTCPEGDPSTALGDSVFSGTTLLAGSDFALSCSEGGAPDRAFAWTAPASGAYRFDTVGSTYDTAIALFDACDGAELECNDDADDLPTYRSAVSRIVAEGETVIVVVSGYSVAYYGDFQVNITDLGLADPTADAATREHDALETVSAELCTCDMGVFATAEQCASFNDLPAAVDSCVDTFYQGRIDELGFQVTCRANAAETYATCLQAASCDAAAVAACTATYQGTDCLDLPDVYQSGLDGCAAIHLLGDGVIPCPDGPVSSAVGAAVFSGTTVLGGNNVNASCGSTAGTSPDRLYEWVAPADGTYTFDTVGSSFDTVLATLDGCDGAELECNDDGGGDLGPYSRLSITVTSGQSVFLHVDGFGLRNAGDFVINITAP